MRSSYLQNNYADVFRAVIISRQLQCCVELGILDGYSLIAIGKALREVGDTFSKPVFLDAYDLFEKYPYKHGKFCEVRDLINKEKLEEITTIIPGDAFKVHANYSDKHLDFLHVDISNTGTTVKKIMKLWDSKIKPGGVILFEGGSAERDKVEWMIKYKMPSLAKELKNNPVIRAKYKSFLFESFPSLTMLIKMEG